MYLALKEDELMFAEGFEDDTFVVYDTPGEMVWEFHDKYFPDVILNPVDFDEDPAQVNAAITGQFTKISEEVDELFEAIEVLQDAVDDEEQVPVAKLDKLQEKVLKEICDVVYTCVGYCTAFGIDFDEAFARVHESNMTKNGDYTGKGGWKLTKGENYVAPDLSDLV